MVTGASHDNTDSTAPNPRGLWLDLFGGSGAIAFELLSNGAENALVVEIHAETAALILRNARELGVEAAVRVLEGDGIRAVEALAGEGQEFDIIVIAPPYEHGLQQEALTALSKNGSLLAAGGSVVVQRDRHESVPETSGGLSLVRTRSYGRTSFDFFGRAECEPS